MNTLEIGAMPDYLAALITTSRMLQPNEVWVV